MVKSEAKKTSETMDLSCVIFGTECCTIRTFVHVSKQLLQDSASSGDNVI